MSDDDNDKYTLKYFQDWINRLKQSVLPKLPSVDKQDNFIKACQPVQTSNESLKAAKALLDNLKNKQAPQDEIDKAQAMVDSQTKALQDAVDLCQELALGLLDGNDMQTFLADSFDDKDLITLVILQQMGPEKLEKWCNRDVTARTQLVKFLEEDVVMQRRFMAGGGARAGEYGRAVELYDQLSQQVELSTDSADVKAVLDRLAMAVALELADPLMRFFCDPETIDPIQRYIHYEQAFMFGELDPAFEHLTVWDLRGVVNNNACDAEIGWGRQCLMNYRPEICYSDDPQWQYCFIVRTDVGYTDPDFYKSPRSYDQILSGGGKCGPRAWYGRFICKAFGIPTWGVKQPGHAAVCISDKQMIEW